MLHVLQIVVAPRSPDGKPTSITGPERRSANLAPRWKDVGVRPLLCYPQRGNLWSEFSDSGLTLIDYEIGHKFNLPSAWQIANIARAYEAKVIHVQGPASLDLFAVLGGRIADIPVVLTRPVMLDDQVTYSSTRKRVYRLIDESLTLKLAEAVVAVSENGRRRLETVSRVAASKLQMIHNGVKLDRFAGRASPTGNGTGTDIPVTLGMVAQLFPPKGWEDFVRVVSGLKDSGLNVRGMIVGEGEMRDTLERMVSDMGLSDTISFAGFQHDVRTVLAEFDIFLFTSKREGLSVAVIEAMASGLPIVATDVGGIGEQVEQGANGYVVPPGDVESLMERCASLVTDPDKRTRFSARSRELAVNRFSEDRMLEEYAGLYKRLADQTS